MVCVVKTVLSICNKKWCFLFILQSHPYLLTLPLFARVSRVRALSPAWTGSRAREINLPHTPFPPARYPPTKKSSTIKS